VAVQPSEIQLQFSIIIPYRRFCPHVAECLQTCLELDYPRDAFEIILLPDLLTSEAQPTDSRIRVLPTGPVLPSEKRNVGAAHSTAPFCAFIDSDAYPEGAWLRNADRILAGDDRIGCLGGPNHIPPGSPFLEQIGTQILFSRLGVGAFPAHQAGDALIEVKEMASSNLIVRMAAFREAGGYDPDLLTGEDARLCFQISHLGYRVVFSRDVAVFHHRRAFPWPFLRSIWIYGRDKAWVVKEMFSLDKCFYFIPSLFVLFLTAGLAAALLVPLLFVPYVSVLALYGLAVTIQAMFFRPVPAKFIGLAGIPATHIAYGIGFWTGLFTRKKRRLRPT
jgi:cellulose synthase/poly-beta-1,6-N-acetylglucosamine synthase-like glycosyltransferase